MPQLGTMGQNTIAEAIRNANASGSDQVGAAVVNRNARLAEFLAGKKMQQQYLSDTHDKNMKRLGIDPDDPQADTKFQKALEKGHWEETAGSSGMELKHWNDMSALAHQRMSDKDIKDMRNDAAKKFDQHVAAMDMVDLAGRHIASGTAMDLKSAGVMEARLSEGQGQRLYAGLAEAFQGDKNLPSNWQAGLNYIFGTAAAKATPQQKQAMLKNLDQARQIQISEYKNERDQFSQMGQYYPEAGSMIPGLTKIYDQKFGNAADRAGHWYGAKPGDWNKDESQQAQPSQAGNQPPQQQQRKPVVAPGTPPGSSVIDNGSANSKGSAVTEKQVNKPGSSPAQSLTPGAVKGGNAPAETDDEFLARKQKEHQMRMQQSAMPKQTSAVNPDQMQTPQPAMPQQAPLTPPNISAQNMAMNTQPNPQQDMLKRYLSGQMNANTQPAIPGQSAIA